MDNSTPYEIIKTLETEAMARVFMQDIRSAEDPLLLQSAIDLVDSKHPAIAAEYREVLTRDFNWASHPKPTIRILLFVYFWSD